MDYGCAKVSECGVGCDPVPGGFAAPSPGGQAAARAAHIGAANLHCQLVWIWNPLHTLFWVYL